MTRLALIWDGRWLTWLPPGEGGKVGRREIVQVDMIPEVLKALRNQVGAGVQVVASEWGQPTTVVPAEMSPQGADNAWMNDAHAMHHGAQAGSSQGCKGMVLEQLNELPVAIVCPSEDWTVALNATFPQARSIHWADVLVRDLVQWGREQPFQGWSLRVDVRKGGASMTAMVGERLQWVHRLEEGFQPEDALYAMVNAIHRGEGEVGEARVLWSGDRALTNGWERFLPVIQPTPEPDGWKSVAQTLVSCG